MVQGSRIRASAGGRAAPNPKQRAEHQPALELLRRAAELLDREALDLGEEDRHVIGTLQADHVQLRPRRRRAVTRAAAAAAAAR